MTKSLVLIGSLGTALAMTPGVATSGDLRAVIELFTSQGCSSCPAADRLLSELRKDNSVITLSLPIDYWDYLGWKDTLALPGHTHRQKAYSQMRGDREVYTPQVVVNGIAQALGSDRGEIEKAVVQSRGRMAALSLPIHVEVKAGQVTVSVPQGEIEGSGEVWLCPLSRTVMVTVGRGENKGRTVTYTNVVRRWVKIGTWSGKGEDFAVPLQTLLPNAKSADIDAVAAIVQGGSADKPGVVFGASLASTQ